MLRVINAIGVCTLAIVPLAGCSGSSLQTHPVRGKVELKDGDVALLTGSHVELRHETDEALRASGKIAAGGDFTLETLHQGQLLSGVPEGKYKVRIILADESDEGIPKRPANLLHRRFLDFDTSGIAFAVPGGEYTARLARK